jgi:hypothetical protein
MDLPTGRFKKSARNTEIDVIIKKGKFTPGPGAYSTTPVGFNKIIGGKSDKAPHSNFITT